MGSMKELPDSSGGNLTGFHDSGIHIQTEIFHELCGTFLFCRAESGKTCQNCRSCQNAEGQPCFGSQNRNACKDCRRGSGKHASEKD